MKQRKWCFNMSSKINIAIEELSQVTIICEKCEKCEYLDELYDNIQEWIDKGYDILTLQDLEVFINDYSRSS